MGFARQESWSGLPFPSAGDLPDPGLEPVSLALQADSLPSELPGTSSSLMKSKVGPDPVERTCLRFTFYPLEGGVDAAAAVGLARLRRAS